MDVAGAQGTPFQIAELVEQEQGMLAGASEVSVVGRALLLAVCRADAAVHVEDDPRRQATVRCVLRGQGYASVLMAAEQGFRSEDQPVEAPISGEARDPGESAGFRVPPHRGTVLGRTGGFAPRMAEKLRQNNGLSLRIRVAAFTNWKGSGSYNTTFTALIRDSPDGS